MGQRCTKELSVSEDHEESEALSADDDDGDSDHQGSSTLDDLGGAASSRSARNSTNDHNSFSNSQFSNEFRRKGNRSNTTMSANAGKRRASNYNDIHIQVSEQLMQAEEKNQQASINEYRPMGVVGLQNLGNT